MLIARFGIAILAVILAGVIWYAFVRLLVLTGIVALKGIAFWLSNETIIGYVFYGFLSIFLYELLTHWMLAEKSKKRGI